MENPDQSQYQPQPVPEPQPQYQYQQPQGPQDPQQPPLPQNDPGKTLGIVGFIFAFVGLQLVGLILSIIGFKKSKKAGFKNTLAVAGIIINSIILALVVGFIALLIFVSSSSYISTTDKAYSANSKSAAANTVKWAELYYNDNGTYPKTFSEIDKKSIVTASENPIMFQPAASSEIDFYSCGETGIKVGYFDYGVKEVLYMYAGKANSSTNCSFSAS